MRLVLASLCFIALVAPAAAQQSPDLVNQVYSCASIGAEAERLACYDAAVGRMREAQNRGDLVAVDRAQAETIQREAFGFSMPSLPRLFNRGDGEDAAVMEFEIAEVDRRSDGRVFFTMTNGQTWAQTESLTNRLVRPGGNVTIRRASLGSFLMSVEAGGPALRVRRTS